MKVEKLSVNEFVLPHQEATFRFYIHVAKKVQFTKKCKSLSLGPIYEEKSKRSPHRYGCPKTNVKQLSRVIYEENNK